jgi:hypothetical protein
MAMGHLLGDSLTPFLESDPVLSDVDEHFSSVILVVKIRQMSPQRRPQNPA